MLNTVRETQPRGIGSPEARAVVSSLCLAGHGTCWTTGVWVRKMTAWLHRRTFTDLTSTGTPTGHPAITKRKRLFWANGGMSWDRRKEQWQLSSKRKGWRSRFRTFAPHFTLFEKKKVDMRNFHFASINLNSSSKLEKTDLYRFTWTIVLRTVF